MRQAVDIEFAIVRGERIFVERIDIEGNTTTLDAVIRRQFRTVEGDPLNRRDVALAAERIRAACTRYMTPVRNATVTPTAASKSRMP